MPRQRSHLDFPLRNFIRCAECGEPLSGSWSRGRSGYYAYYHCQDGCTRVRKEQAVREFIDLVARLQPKPEYMRLFNEAVKQVWNDKHADRIAAEKAVRRNLQELKTNKEKLERAFIFDTAVDRETYRTMRTRLIADLTAAEIELRNATADAIDIDVILDFAEDVLLNASNLWKAAEIQQKQRLQQVLFPEGVEYGKGGYRTALTCLLFNGMEAEKEDKSSLVALPGIEPGF